MRIRFSLVLTLVLSLLSACGAGAAKHHTAAVSAPSLAGIRGAVADSQAANARARADADRIGAGLQSARSDAQRIEDKAVVVLKYLR